MPEGKDQIDFLIKAGFTENEAGYIQQHPCLENNQDECKSHKTEGCYGCIMMNGFLTAVTEPNGKPRAVDLKNYGNNARTIARRFC
jgi:hypothetical protein